MMARWRKLRWQLMLSYIPLIFVPVLLVGLVTRSAAEQGLTLLVTQGSQRQAHVLSGCFASYYENHGSWDGLSTLLKQPAPNPGGGRPPGPPQDADSILHHFVLDGNLTCDWVDEAQYTRMFPGGQPGQGFNGQGPFPPDQPQPNSIAALFPNFRPGDVLIADTSGKITVSVVDANIGQTLSTNTLAQGAPIFVQGKQIGTLLLGLAIGAFDEGQRQLLDSVNSALLLSGTLSVILAAALGWALSGQITVPMKRLMSGARRLARGEWSMPLAVDSPNEFGELTHTFNGMANEIIHQQQLNRQMIADIAHDLRTPLSAMTLEVEAIEAGLQTPDQATASLREEITFLQRLVEDLRLLSLMDADQIKLQKESVPLNSFMDSVFDFWQTMASEEGRTLSLNIPQSLPRVSIDPGRMRQVLGNLIDNAIRYTKPDGKITLSAKAEGSQAIIAVSDNGEGISPQDLPHIFDRFYRVDPARRRTSGSGLGLSISRRLIELHDGSISAESTPGKGTTFTITLPMA